MLCGAAIFLALPFIPRIFGFSIHLIKTVLGLEGRARSARRRKLAPSPVAAGDADLGPSEAAVISKYGMPDDATIDEGL